MPKPRTLRAVAPLLAAMLLAGCNSTGTVQLPDSGIILEAASPQSLRGTAGGPLKTPPVVVARDERGQALRGVPVSWRVAAGGGALADSVTVTDAAGQAAALWTLPSTPGTYSAVAALSMDGSGVQFDATAGLDTVPPRLVGLVFPVDSVEVGAEAVPLRLTVVAADSGSGLYWTVLDLRSPSGGQTTSCTVLAGASDTTAERSVSCSLEIPAHAEPGAWQVDFVTLQDRIRNEAQLPTAALAGAGFPTTMVVSALEPDTAPPTLLTLSFEPDSVAVDSADATVVFTAQLFDSIAGVQKAQLAVDAPAGTGFVECLDMDRVDGDSRHGTWQCPVTIPQGAHPGTWTVARFTAWDEAGNWKNWLHDELVAGGVPTEITVTNADADTVPPVLLGVAVQPDSVHLAGGDVPVVVSLSVADDGMGVQYAEVSLRAPGANSASGCRMESPSEGTTANGVYRCTLTIPAAGVAGEWALDYLTVVDGAGNHLDLDTQGLVDAGFDPYVEVTR